MSREYALHFQLVLVDLHTLLAGEFEHRPLHFVVYREPVGVESLVQQSLGGSPNRLPSFDEARDEFTRNYLSQILQITGGNVSQAARLAKRNRTDFYKLLSRHQLVPDDFKKN